MAFYIEQLMNRGGDRKLSARIPSEFVGKYGIRIPDEDIVFVPVFTFKYYENSNVEMKYVVNTMHTIFDPDRDNVHLLSEGIKTLDSAFKYIIDKETLYRSCNMNFPSVICVSENSLPAQDYFDAYG